MKRPSKARLLRRLSASGWTIRAPQAWLTIHRAPSGLVEIWDRGRSGDNRYMVMYRDGGQWLASCGTSNFDDAVRVAIKDLGLIESHLRRRKCGAKAKSS